MLLRVSRSLLDWGWVGCSGLDPHPSGMAKLSFCQAPPSLAGAVPPLCCPLSAESLVGASLHSGPLAHQRPCLRAPRGLNRQSTGEFLGQQNDQYFAWYSYGSYTTPCICQNPKSETTYENWKIKCLGGWEISRMECRYDKKSKHDKCMKGVVRTDTKSHWKWAISRSTGEGTIPLGAEWAFWWCLHVPGTERLAEQTLGGGSQFSLLEASLQGSQRGR